MATPFFVSAKKNLIANVSLATAFKFSARGNGETRGVDRAWSTKDINKLIPKSTVSERRNISLKEAYSAIG